MITSIRSLKHGPFFFWWGRRGGDISRYSTVHVFGLEKNCAHFSFVSFSIKES